MSDTAEMAHVKAAILAEIGTINQQLDSAPALSSGFTWQYIACGQVQGLRKALALIEAIG